MSGVGEPTLDLANAEDIRLAIIASQWHEVICTSLLNGAIAAATAAGVADLTVIRVAGAIENEPARVFGAMHSSGSNPLKVGEVVAKYECNHENEKHILQYVEHQFGQIFLAVSHLPA